MALIYLLTILDDLTIAATIFLFISLTGLILCTLQCVNIKIDLEEYPKSDYSKVSYNLFKKLRNTCLGILIPTLLISIFCPTKKDAIEILSIGTTIDYVKNNEKIKELPDKAILCLDKFINEYLNETDSNQP